MVSDMLDLIMGKAEAQSGEEDKGQVAKIDSSWSYHVVGNVHAYSCSISVDEMLDILGYDPSNSLIKDPIDYVKHIKKLADLSSSILKTIDESL